MPYTTYSGLLKQPDKHKLPNVVVYRSDQAFGRSRSRRFLRLPGRLSCLRFPNEAFRTF